MTEKRIKAGIALTPRHLKLCDDNLRRAGVRSRNDFVERAIVCYADQLLRQELPELPGGGFDGSRFETLCKSLGTGPVSYTHLFLDEGEVAFGSTEYIVLAPRKNVPSEMLYCLARYPAFVDYAVKNMNGSSGRQRVSAETIGQFRDVYKRQLLHRERACLSKSASLM